MTSSRSPAYVQASAALLHRRALIGRGHVVKIPLHANMTQGYATRSWLMERFGAREVRWTTTQGPEHILYYFEEPEMAFEFKMNFG